jgi:hypothetical protein
MTFDLDKEGILDSTPLKFGKHKGKKPEDMAVGSLKDQEYLRWAYENVGNNDVCSRALYHELGGRGTRAIPDGKYPNRRSDAPQNTGDYEPGNYGTETGRFHSRAPAPANKPKPASGFDDMDDDIPF